LRSVIVDQASDIEHSWRELVQNGLDSPSATRVELDWDHDKTVYHDNGGGVDLSAQRGQDLLTNLGESSKNAEDDESIGEFGIGKGQYLAKGRTALIDGDDALLFDVQGELGLDVVCVDTDDLVEQANELTGNGKLSQYVQDALETYGRNGMTIVLDHYGDEVPDFDYKWNSHQSAIEKRFKFAEIATATKVYVNDERISDFSPGGEVEHKYTHAEEFSDPATDLERAHIAVGHNTGSDLGVYSNGVYVCDVESRGLSGVIVTEGNLRLNFARNEIKSGCHRFTAIENRLEEIRLDLYSSMPDNRLTLSSRDFLAEQLLDHGNEEFVDTELFKTINGDHVSLADVKSRSSVASSRPGKGAGDKLSESLGMIVLSELDDATGRLLEVIEVDEVKSNTEDDQNSGTEVDIDIDVEDATEKAESMGLHTSYERFGMGDLKPVQRTKLAIAREMADRIEDYDREIYYGESDVAKSWTDASTYVTITDSSTSSNAWQVYAPELWRQLVHEMAHVTSSKKESDHGYEFNRRYRNLNDDQHEVLSEVIQDIRDRGLDAVKQNAPKY
jgi:hypothetical protein